MSNIHIISPTGFGIRSDPAGDGHYGAPRGGRTHEGLDFICKPGQEVIAPFTGYIDRIAYPYGDDLRWSGCVFTNEHLTVMMFYMKPDRKAIREEITIEEGSRIGIAQDITKKYPNRGMLPHIHLQIESIDPETLLIWDYDSDEFIGDINV